MTTINSSYAGFKLSFFNREYFQNLEKWGKFIEKERDRYCTYAASGKKELRTCPHRIRQIKKSIKEAYLYAQELITEFRKAKASKDWDFQDQYEDNFWQLIYEINKTREYIRRHREYLKEVKSVKYSTINEAWAQQYSGYKKQKD